jgi:hypothetical protein
MDLTLERVTTKKAEIIFWVVLTFLLILTSVFPNASGHLFGRIFKKFILGCSVALWVYCDSKSFKEITQEKANAYSIMCVMLPEIICPIYLFSTRGFKRGIIGLCKFILKLLVIAVIVIPTLSYFGYE